MGFFGESSLFEYFLLLQVILTHIPLRNLRKSHMVHQIGFYSV